MHTDTITQKTTLQRAVLQTLISTNFLYQNVEPKQKKRSHQRFRVSNPEVARVDGTSGVDIVLTLADHHFRSATRLGHGEPLPHHLADRPRTLGRALSALYATALFSDRQTGCLFG